MNEAAANPIITAMIGERMRRLATPRAWRSAIKSGQIKRATMVGFELPGEDAQTRRADEIPQLEALFDAILGEMGESEDQAGGQDAGETSAPAVVPGREVVRLERRLASVSAELAEAQAVIAALESERDEQAARIAALENSLALQGNAPVDPQAAPVPAPAPNPSPTPAADPAPPANIPILLGIIHGLESEDEARTLAAQHGAIFHSNADAPSLADLVPSESDRFWLVPDGGTGNSALLFPGYEVFRFWHMMNTPRAEHPLGHHFDLLPGRRLEVSRPARLSREGQGRWTLVEKGEIAGMQG